VSNLRSCSPLAYIDNEHAKQLLYALDDHVWGMRITALVESADFTNNDASFTSKALITSARVGGHDANPTNTASFALEFSLSSLAVASDEQYKSIPNDEIALLARKFCALHKFRRERRISPRGCFKCGDTTYFITDCPKRKKFDSSNKYDYANHNDSSNKGDNNMKNRFGDNNKKKFQKIMC
jgi:hypothetical protein